MIFVVTDFHNDNRVVGILTVGEETVEEAAKRIGGELTSRGTDSSMRMWYWMKKVGTEDERFYVEEVDEIESLE